VPQQAANAGKVGGDYCVASNASELREFRK
jgi:hypothetical protein